MRTSDAIREELEARSDPERAAVLRRFFKTGPGEYAEGDLFRGIRVPELRALARKYRGAVLADATRLLASPFHEDRLLALFLLIRLYSRGDGAVKERIYRLYLDSTRFINNWDLVDGSAEHIVGDFLTGRSKEPLTRLAMSGSLWERRIAVMATFRYIKEGMFEETLRIAGLLLEDKEDLIHKAAGWMLREVGKRDRAAAERFLRAHCRRMPRTMLRYAIERFPDPVRLAYLAGTACSAGQDPPDPSFPRSRRRAPSRSG